MEQVLNSLKGIKLVIIICIAALLLSFHVAFVYFVNSTFLSTFISKDAVGFLYTLGAIVNIASFLLIPKLTRKKGAFKLIIWFTLVEMVALLGMAFSPSGIITAALFVLHFAMPSLIAYCMDILLESLGDLKTIGSLRGIYLTLVNIPYVVTPFVVGLILITPEYWKIYLISAAFLLPFLILVISYFKTFKDPQYASVDIKEVLPSFYHNKNLFDIFLDNFLLQFFYGWSVIYMPLYLRNNIGFNWEEIGLMFSIMLLPFIIFQIPIGRIEDKKHDEKQILILGFAIIAGSTLIIPFIRDANFILWTIILFVSRIGASMVEVSCESYFFKHITPDNASYISFFRMTRALPFLIAPAIVGLSFIFVGFSYSFVVLGVIMLLGVRYAFQISDR